MKFSYVSSPVGQILIAGDQEGLKHVIFPTGKNAIKAPSNWVRDDDFLKDVSDQLTAYFAGERTSFDLKLAPTGTSFQRSVLEALLDIPYGQTRSYAEIAQAVGRPKAYRAVGSANGRNPLSIVIPCHRVIGASGALTGFGGGLETKKVLLDLEKKYKQE